MSEALPYALGVAVSPVPIAAILLLLTCREAVAKGLSFLAGWTVGVVVPALVFVVLVNRAGVSDSDPAWITVVELVLGVAFALGAMVLWTRRHRRRERTSPWVDGVDSLTTVRSAGLGVVLSGGNPKVVALSLGAALALAQADASTATTAGGVALYAMVGAAGISIPLAVYLVTPSSADSILRWLRAWLARHETTVLVVLGFLIGALFLTDGLQGL